MPIREGPEGLTVHYKTRAQLFNDIEELIRRDEDFLVCEGVTPPIFASFDKRREAQSRHFRVHYLEREQRMYIRTPSAIREAMHLGLYELLLLYQSGRDWRLSWRDWIPSGAATFVSLDRVRMPGLVEGDSTAGPWPSPWRRADDDRLDDDKDRKYKAQYNPEYLHATWPTLVIEAGCSQSLESMRQGMRRLFVMSAHRVKVVLLAKLFRDTRTLRVELYTEDPPAHPRAGAAANTRHAPQPEPVLRQAVVVAPAGDGREDPPRYKAVTTTMPKAGDGDGAEPTTDTPLTVRLEDFLLRPPDGAKGETDLVADPAALEELAETVCGQIRFMSWSLGISDFLHLKQN